MQLRKPDGVFPKTFQHCPRSSGSLERWKSLLSKTVTLQAQCESLWVRQALSCNLPALIAQSLALLREHHVNHVNHVTKPKRPRWTKATLPTHRLFLFARVSSDSNPMKF